MASAVAASHLQFKDDLRGVHAAQPWRVRVPHGNGERARGERGHARTELALILATGCLADGCAPPSAQVDDDFIHNTTFCQFFILAGSLLSIFPSACCVRALLPFVASSHGLHISLLTARTYLHTSVRPFGANTSSFFTAITLRLYVCTYIISTAPQVLSYLLVFCYAAYLPTYCLLYTSPSPRDRG